VAPSDDGRARVVCADRPHRGNRHCPLAPLSPEAAASTPILPHPPKHP
jgi:hypothetical protein